MADEPRNEHEVDPPGNRRCREEQELSQWVLWSEVERLRSMLDAAYGSVTFRLGWALMAPWRLLRGESGPPPRPHRSPEVKAAVGVVIAGSDRELHASGKETTAAVDLARRLLEHGFYVLHCAPAQWYDLPPGGRIYLSALAEPRTPPDLSRVPASMLRVAWIGGDVRCWIDQGMLPLYDLVLCSSQHTADTIREHFAGPIEILPMGGGDGTSSAASFEARVRPSLDAPRRRAIVVGFSPDYRSANPYQALLYMRSQRRDIVTMPVKGPGEMLARPGLEGHEIVYHQHWTHAVLGPPGSDAETARERLDSYLGALDLLAARGGHLVWTIHNVLPHECPHPEIEIELRRELAARADAIHVLGRRTAAIVEELYPLPQGRRHVIEHPSYVGVYPSIVDREVARAELGIALDRRVYLALGQLRPYKGIERLLAAFETYAKENLKALLVIAGQPGRFEGANALLARCRESRQTLLIDEHVEDDRLQVLLRASDVVVAPHERVLNSGLVWLAFAFARPVVAPGAGEVQDVVTPEVGVLFDPEGGAEALLAALREADRLGPAQGRRAFDIALAHPPAQAAARFAELVEQLASSTGRRSPSSRRRIANW